MTPIRARVHWAGWEREQKESREVQKGRIKKGKRRENEERKNVMDDIKNGTEE